MLVWRREDCQVFDIYTCYSPVRLVSSSQRLRWKQTATETFCSLNIKFNVIATNKPFQKSYETLCSSNKDKVRANIHSHGYWAWLIFLNADALFECLWQMLHTHRESDSLMLKKDHDKDFIVFTEQLCVIVFFCWCAHSWQQSQESKIILIISNLLNV